MFDLIHISFILAFPVCCFIHWNATLSSLWGHVTPRFLLNKEVDILALRIAFRIYTVDAGLPCPLYLPGWIYTGPVIFYSTFCIELCVLLWLLPFTFSELCLFYLVVLLGYLITALPFYASFTLPFVLAFTFAIYFFHFYDLIFSLAPPFTF